MNFKTITSFPIPLRSIQRSGRKSRRDGILLTVDFNLRTRSSQLSPQSPAGTTLWSDDIVSSLRDFGGKLFRLFRRLKPPVNKVLSLRDFSSLKLHCYKLFVFHPLEKGEAIGMEKEKMEIALKLLKMGMSVEMVSDATGLTERQTEDLL